MLVWRTLTLCASIAACIVSLSSVFFQVLLPGKDLVSPSIEGEEHNAPAVVQQGRGGFPAELLS